jgi:hypothetical protein
MIHISSKYIGNKKLTNTHLRVRQAFYVILASLAFTSCIAQAATTYTMKDIGINPTAINSTGQVLGSLYKVYDNGSLTDIHTMTGVALLNQGTDINTSGQVVGYGANTGSAFIRNSDGTFVNVGPSPDPNFRPAAALTINDVNDAGQVQVAGALSNLLTTCIQHSYLGSTTLGSTTSPEIIDIGHLGGDRTNVRDINASGVVVGQSSIKMPGFSCPLIPNYHAFIFSATAGIQDLHSPAMLGNDSIAYKINNTGLVAGNFANGTVPDLSGYYPSGYPIRHAVIWNLTSGTYRDVGNGSLDSSLLAINDSGVAVGFERTIINFPCISCGPTTSGQHAVLVDTNGTTLIDLNTLVPGLPAGWSIRTANDINNEGQIVALAYDTSGAGHGLLLTPTTSTTATAPPPPAPSGLAAAIISSSQINLSWIDNASNEISQILERCQELNCTNFVEITALAPGVTSFNDTALTASTQYSYRIKAQNTAGVSSYSNTVTATTLPPTDTVVPAAPSNLVGTATSTRRIILSWSDNSDNEQNFVVERCQGVGCTGFTAVAQVAANSVSFSNGSLSRNTSYSYRVKAINATGSSSYSNISSAKTFN